MTLSEFRYIVAVAAELHFGRAASRCFVSQPTLSVAVKKLEEELGVILFERHQHEVSVTPIGEAIVRQAQLILNETNNLKEIAAQNKDELMGGLKLGLIYTVGPYLLPRLIPLLRDQGNHRFPLLIEEDFTEGLARKLKAGFIDIAILSRPFHKAGITTEALYREHFIVALPRGHALGAKKKLRPADLMGNTMLLLKAGNCFRDQVVEFCPACVSPPKADNGIQKTLEGSSIETIRQMVAAGAGITILPGLSVESSSMQGLLEYRPFAEPAPFREIIIAYRKSYPGKKAIALIKNAIKSCGLDTRAGPGP